MPAAFATGASLRAFTTNNTPPVSAATAATEHASVFLLTIRTVPLGRTRRIERRRLCLSSTYGRCDAPGRWSRMWSPAHYGHHEPVKHCFSPVRHAGTEERA